MRDQVIAVTVLGHDRPGIVADVTGALADLHGNLEDSTMTLLRGHFAMVLLVHTGAGAAAVEAALRPLTAGGALVINARVLDDPGFSEVSGPSYALRVHGADRPGIVATITAVVARHQANIVDLGTRSLLGVEALVRWRHPELGVLMPDRFIQIAEECGQIVKLGRWVLAQASKPQPPTR